MMTRLPAIPLVANDPYFSIWLPADRLTDADSAHWCGPVKPLRGKACVDCATYRFLGLGEEPAMPCVSQTVTPTRTEAAFEVSSVRLTARFLGCAFPDDLDTLSAPVTLLSWTFESLDGRAHDVQLSFSASESLVYAGDARPAMIGDEYVYGGANVAYAGQLRQKPLSHSGDHTTIDWGYLYLVSQARTVREYDNLTLTWAGTVSDKTEVRAAIGLDDLFSIDYFGAPCRAWYMRGGETLVHKLTDMLARFDDMRARCEAWDEKVLSEARAVGGADYAQIVSAAWRHAFAAGKLIATPEGEMAFLTKENDSNGCIGTVDVAYPASPIFLKYAPELANALCRPVMYFASLPVWSFDFAPHDVGRYPYATGQVYALKKHVTQGETYPPYYTYPASREVYDFAYQMPVEECGNMLALLAAAVRFGAGKDLIEKYEPVVDQWKEYLLNFGEDPGEQLCTDDFAGHLARNVNLAAKAAVGVACYGLIRDALGHGDGDKWREKGHEMARSVVRRAGDPKEGTFLTFDGAGWSMKYNFAWDRVLDLALLPDDFYDAETRSYLKRLNPYGLPLDSRAAYTKSDWIAWCASMAPDADVANALLAPVARYLRKTSSRVAFSDWYDTETGDYVHFIARPVQGGMFMPMLKKR